VRVDGQIVGYPIVDLRDKGIGIRVFVEKLEETFIQLLKDNYGIDAGRNPEFTGVWVENSKITAIGLAVKHGVTMHGFAFNVNTNLEDFKWINPCGIVDKWVTSLEKLLGRKMDYDEVSRKVLEYFCEVFQVEPVIISEEGLLEEAE
jgi:lipoyl(octanoyl) transferase